MSGTIVVPEHNLEFSNQIILCRLRYGITFFRIPILLFRVSGSGFFIKTRGRRERYPTKFWKCWGPGTGKILKVGYRLVPGTDQILKVGYRWVPGTEQILKSDYSIFIFPNKSKFRPCFRNDTSMNAHLSKKYMRSQILHNFKATKISEIDRKILD